GRQDELMYPRPPHRDPRRDGAHGRPGLLRRDAARRPDRHGHRPELPGRRDHGLPLRRPLRRARHPGRPGPRARRGAAHPVHPVLRGRACAAEPARVGGARDGRVRVGRGLPHRARAAPAVRGGEPQGGRDRRHLRLPHALRRGHLVGRPGRGGRRLPVHRLRRLLHAGHERGPRVHRARRPDRRALVPLHHAGGDAAHRLLQRAGPAAARVQPGDRHPVPGAALRPHALRRRGHRRAVRAARGRRRAVQEGGL
ncbi:MAG: ABC transporter, permease protein 2 (cluster 11, riboflavin/purine nucleoside/unknown), partial [uncultured Thermoleophilia bacterium]